MEQNKQSGLETAAKLARAIQAAVRIARAAAAGGLYGAAAQTVKEALPALVKLAIGLFIGFVLVPLLILMSVPNIFFGFDSSKTEDILSMNAQAAAMGGAYLSLEDFQKTKMDSVITGVVSGYENAGIVLDSVSTSGSFSEDDLYWYIAIHSVYYQQDLSKMSAQSLQTLSNSALDYTETLTPTQMQEEQQRYALEIRFGNLDAEALMTHLNFDDEAKNWAKLLYQSLKDSDALNTYGDRFEAHQPSYNGDTGYSGGVEYGEASGPAAVSKPIDTSGFSSPSTKNNLDLASYAVQAFENGWGYVWGTYGCTLTESLLSYKLEQYPELAANADYIRQRWLGGRTTDCVGLIKGYGWLDAGSGSLVYASNGMPDLNADSMYGSATESGSMDTMPEVKGLALWLPGHIGVYIGGGYAIEAMGTRYGVVKTAVEGRGWKGWCKIPYIQYNK